MVRAGVVALNVQIERAVLVELQSIPVPNGVPIDRIRYKIAIFVVGRDGPKRAHRRQVRRLEMHPVPNGAIKGLSARVGRASDVYGIFRRIRTNGDPSRNGPSHIVGSIASHSSLKRAP